MIESFAAYATAANICFGVASSRASTLSHRNHLSVISIDFEKAFDRVGVHTIISQLKEWKFGKKIINFVFAFLSKRRIRVKVNNVYFSTKPLDNGIPQGSPLSVVLFQIATDKLNKIISYNTYVKHVIYADDLYLIYKHCQNIDIQNLVPVVLVADCERLSGFDFPAQSVSSEAGDVHLEYLSL